MDVRKGPKEWPTVVARPAGGFRPIGVQQLLAAWSCYRTGLLRKYFDFRVYLALHEVDEQGLAGRRTRARRGRPAPANRLNRNALERDLMILVRGSSLRMVRTALRRIERAGLAFIQESGIVIPAIGASNDNAGTATAQSVSPRKFGARRVPVPRRMLRYLARTASPSVAATALGHLIFTLFWEGCECRIRGTCTVKQISDLFDVHSRSVKRARAHLRRIRWLPAVGEHHDDSGSDLMINLTWSYTSNESEHARKRGTILSPVRASLDTDMSPSTSKVQLPPGCTHQPPPGDRMGLKGRQVNAAMSRFTHIHPTDLDDPARLDALFEQAATQGFVRPCAGDRLKFFAAAERAKRVSTQNRCGFFADFIRRGLWDFLSQTDEDRAIERIKESERSAMQCFEPRNGFAPKASPAGLLTNKEGIRPEVRTMISDLVSRLSMEPPPCLLSRQDDGTIQQRILGLDTG